MSKERLTHAADIIDYLRRKGYYFYDVGSNLNFVMYPDSAEPKDSDVKLLREYEEEIREVLDTDLFVQIQPDLHAGKLIGLVRSQIDNESVFLCAVKSCR